MTQNPRFAPVCAGGPAHTLKCLLCSWAANKRRRCRQWPFSSISISSTAKMSSLSVSFLSIFNGFFLIFHCLVNFSDYSTCFILIKRFLYRNQVLDNSFKPTASADILDGIFPYIDAPYKILNASRTRFFVSRGIPFFNGLFHHVPTQCSGTKSPDHARIFGYVDFAVHDHLHAFCKPGVQCSAAQRNTTSSSIFMTLAMI